MSSDIYTETEANTSSEYASRNNITIAVALNGRRLTKIAYPDPSQDVQYDQTKYYKFFNRDVYCLSDILEYVKVLLYKSDCCLIRGVCKDDTISKQRRLFHGEDATVIEQPQNWYALDIDNYGECSGDLKRDAKTVLLALGLCDVEAFAIPSSGYMRKPGIRIRLFLWNSVRVSCGSLKKHFNSVADLALFHPIQPIYIARPIFKGMNDPCKEYVAWISGNQHSNIVETYTPGQSYKEPLHTKKQAQNFLNSVLREVFDIDKDRHIWLINRSSWLGRCIGQGVLDEEDVIEELYLATAIWGGNRKKDMQTIVDGVRKGKLNPTGE
jgi:hypothetical protein